MVFIGLLCLKKADTISAARPVALTRYQKERKQLGKIYEKAITIGEPSEN